MRTSVLFSLAADALASRVTASTNMLRGQATGQGDAPSLTTRPFNNNFSVKFSEQGFITSPTGAGRIKALDPNLIQGNTMGFAYLELFYGGVRELHWHPLSAEWGYVLSGTCRIALMNNDGQYTNDEANEGDVWYFPKSWGHSIQGVHPKDGCTMVLFFDDAQTPLYNDLSISELITKFPTKVLSDNLGAPPSVIDSMKSDMATFSNGITTGFTLVNKGPVPPPKFPSKEFPESDNPLPDSPLFSVYDGVCTDTGKGGYIYQVTNDMWPVTLTMSGGLMHLDEGSFRDIHWHPNADEMQYVISGSLNVTTYGIGGVDYTYSINAGDIGFVPKGFAHTLEANGGPVDLLVTFNNPSWKTQELSTWMAVSPNYLTAASLNVDTEVVDKYFPTSTAQFYGPTSKNCPTKAKRNDAPTLALGL
ncbi:hypothetical protein ACHAWF_006355 [Thalassiosira exigua]